MRVLKVIKKIILVILGIIFFAFALAMTVLLLYRNDFGVTKFGDTSMILVNDSISSENFQKGDLVLADYSSLDKLTVGDEVFTYTIAANHSVNINLGTIGKISPEDDAIEFENGSSFNSQYIAGTPTKVYKNYGTYLSVITSKWGFLFIVLVPCFLIFVYEVYVLIVEIKYGDEEEYY